MILDNCEFRCLLLLGRIIAPIMMSCVEYGCFPVFSSSHVSASSNFKLKIFVATNVLLSKGTFMLCSLIIVVASSGGMASSSGMVEHFFPKKL